MAKILVVDDNYEMLETLERIFSFYQFEVITAENGKIAIERAEKENPDVILLDAYMPVMDGFEACQKLKADKKTREIPIVFLTAKYIETEKKIAGLELGADDYLLKPFNSKELVTRIKLILKKTEMMRALQNENANLSLTHDQIMKELEALQNEKRNLERNSFIDSLTGLYNRKYFDTRLREEFLRAKRYGNSVSLLLTDVDEFHKINESLGYQIGDYILMKMANVILTNTRTTDVVARIKEEKYAVILPETDEEGGFVEGERIRRALQESDYIEDNLIGLDNLKRRRKNEHKKMTVSVGLATYPAKGRMESETELYEAALQSLAYAKKNGKNITVAASKVRE